MPKRKRGFTNDSIIPVKVGKPHIVLVGGYWRVSSWVRGTEASFYEAHYFVTRLNNRVEHNA